MGLGLVGGLVGLGLVGGLVGGLAGGLAGVLTGVLAGPYRGHRPWRVSKRRSPFAQSLHRRKSPIFAFIHVTSNRNVIFYCEP